MKSEEGLGGSWAFLSCLNYFAMTLSGVIHETINVTEKRNFDHRIASAQIFNLTFTTNLVLDHLD